MFFRCMKTQPEKHNILILTLNIVRGNNNTIIIGSNLEHSNNANATPVTGEQELLQVIQILLDENAQLKLSIKSLRKLVEMLSKKGTNK